MRRFAAPGAVALAFFFTAPQAWSQAFPINSDVALQPAEGQFIYRTQIRYRDFDLEDPDADVRTWMQSNIFVYGWTSRLSTVVGVPLVHRDVESRGGDGSESGIGDIKLLIRYQLWKKLGFLESQSLTGLAGVEIPSYDDPFSSRSWDPVIGAVYSWRKNRHGFDADLIYQFNTENDRDFEAGDVLRYDAGYQYRLWPAQYESDTRWSLSGLLELNGRYQWDSELEGKRLGETGGHQILLSPGLVLAGRRTKYEAGLQIPIYRNVGDRHPEDNIRAVVGFTISY